MIAAYTSCMRRYARFAGRTSRREFWWFYLTFAILLCAAAGVDAIASGDPATIEEAPLTGLVLVGHLLPAVAACVRRLHDTNRSGWFYLVGLIPVVGPFVLLAWYCQAGTVGANRFAAAPPATSVAAAAPGTRPGPAAVRDPVAEIERLAGMEASGTLSRMEFETLKARVLAGLAPA